MSGGPDGDGSRPAEGGGVQGASAEAAGEAWLAAESGGSIGAGGRSIGSTSTKGCSSVRASGAEA
jgi:hypothetical protein